MRRFISVVSTIALSVLASACGGKTTPVEVDNTPLQVSPATQSVASLGEIKTFTVVSSTDWYARSSASWAKIQTASGKADKSGSPLTVNCEENKGTEPRTAQITVSNLGKETVTVSLDQAAGDGTTPVTRRGIATAEDLVAFAKAVNGEGSIAPFLVDGVVKFLNDIDASSIKEWVPAGTQAMPLKYSINGNNCTIKNVNWTVDLDKYPMAGLIGCATGITVQKLTFGDDGSQVTFTGNPSGKVRAGGIVGRAEAIKMDRVTNNADLVVTGTSATGNNLIIGGVAGYINSDSALGGELKSEGCINNGDITVSVPAQQGGIVGYNSGVITNCSNYGTITGKKEGDYGPGWLCSYNSTKANVTSNYGYGFVGDCPAMMKNAMINYEAGYDLEANTVDWTLDAYYDWETVETRQLHRGATYYHYNCINVPRHIHVLEIDLQDPGIELNSAVADELIPNPNGNGNNNNGYNKRETLSMLCNRRRAEGKKVLAGVNSCFFDSNDGISRGFHVEDGEPVYINNPSVVTNLVNHAWGFTVFTDGTASCLGIHRIHRRDGVLREEKVHRDPPHGREGVPFQHGERYDPPACVPDRFSRQPVHVAVCPRSAFVLPDPHQRPGLQCPLCHLRVYGGCHEGEHRLCRGESGGHRGRTLREHHQALYHGPESHRHRAFRRHGQRVVCQGPERGYRGVQVRHRHRR